MTLLVAIVIPSILDIMVFLAFKPIFAGVAFHDREDCHISDFNQHCQDNIYFEFGYNSPAFDHLRQTVVFCLFKNISY